MYIYIYRLNGRSVVMTFLFDWISLLFLGFVFIISSLVILYSDDYMSGDYNIFRFIMLILIFVVSILFLIISPNIYIYIHIHLTEAQRGYFT
jgi:NADH-ubiquinone oxidoreductase chain 5